MTTTILIVIMVTTKPTQSFCWLLLWGGRVGLMPLVQINTFNFFFFLIFFLLLTSWHNFRAGMKGVLCHLGKMIILAWAAIKYYCSFESLCKIYFSHLWRLGSPRERHLLVIWWWLSFWFGDHHLLVSERGRGRRGRTRGRERRISFYKGINPIMRAPSSWPNYLPN